LRKILSYISAIVLSILITIGSADAKDLEEVTVSNNIDEKEVVSLVKSVEDEITILGLYAPPKSAVVDLTSSNLTFAGKAEVSTLYTNSNFKGKKRVTYSIKNSSSSTLTVTLHKKGSLFSLRSFTVSPGTTKTGDLYPSGNLDASALYYLSFSAPSDFSGRLY
jgi:hypothetical protein